MARLRTIKPGFFVNEDLAECGMAGQLLFVGLWGQADRRGIVEDRPKRLKAALFPYYDVDVDALLDDLATRGFIERYAVDGVRCLFICNFAKHQNPHRDEKPSDLPAPCGAGDSGADPESTNASTMQAPYEHRADTVPATPLTVNRKPSPGDLGVGSGWVAPARDDGETKAEVDGDTTPILAMFGAYAAGAGIGNGTSEWHTRQLADLLALRTAVHAGLDPGKLERMTRYVAETWLAKGITVTPELAKVLKAESEFERWEAAGCPAATARAPNGHGTARPTHMDPARAMAEKARLLEAQGL